MNLDRDLRDALRPLRGDPVEDARAVLAELDDGLPPATVEPPKGLRGLPIAAALLGVLALGIVVGLASGSAFDGEQQNVVDEPEKGGDPNETDENPDDKNSDDGNPEDREDDPSKPDEKKKKPWPPPPPSSSSLLLMAFGEMTVNEPKLQREALKPGSWYVKSGTLFETGNSLAGIFVQGTGSAVRLAQQTVAAVEMDRIDVREGIVWMSTLGEPVSVRIEAELATVLSEKAEVMVERQNNGVVVISFGGDVTVRASAGESRRLGELSRCEIDSTGVIRGVEPVEFPPAVTGWMVPMVINQTDDRELRHNVEWLVEAYVEGTNREAAVRELRRYGGHTVGKLFYALDVVGSDTALLHRTARLIGASAEYSHKDWLFALLERGDEESRAIAFRALVRVGGEENQVEDEGFWRAANTTDRELQLRQWRTRLR
ncbi:MAG: hypothetical protein NXI31_16075 [bacterium]|nr:hypothetical protein [bacterium]